MRGTQSRNCWVTYIVKLQSSITPWLYHSASSMYDTIFTSHPGSIIHHNIIRCLSFSEIAWVYRYRWFSLATLGGDTRNEWNLPKFNSKQQYCLGTWKVGFMNQGKLEVVKWERARENINILGISELKWSGIIEFNSDDHYIYYCGQESLRRYGVALIVNKSLKCSTWVQSQKW